MVKQYFFQKNFFSKQQNKSFFTFFSKKVRLERKICENVLKSYFSNYPNLKNLPSLPIFPYLKKTNYYYLFPFLHLNILEQAVLVDLVNFLNKSSSPNVVDKIFTVSVRFPDEKPTFFKKLLLEIKKLKVSVDKKLLKFFYPAIFGSLTCNKLFKLTPIISNSVAFLSMYLFTNDLLFSFSNLFYLNIPFIPIYYSFYLKNKLLDWFSFKIQKNLKEASQNAFNNYILNYRGDDLIWYFYKN